MNPDPRHIAETAITHALLNCYLRETGGWDIVNVADRPADDPVHATAIPAAGQSFIRCDLPLQGVQLLAGLRYYSPTGRHLFNMPLYYRTGPLATLPELDYITLTALLINELTLQGGSGNSSNPHREELLTGVMDSCRNIERFVRHRLPDAATLYAFTSNFSTTEQALMFGHPLHPTPKSRPGFADDELAMYSPELTGRFPLYYFRAHQSIVASDSALSQSAAALIKAELLADDTVDAVFKETCCQPDDYALLPLHPWQAAFQRQQPAVQQLIEQGLLQDLGPQGQPFETTSSLRTVYRAGAVFMVKLSLGVMITNSLRSLVGKELNRGALLHRLLNAGIGQQLSRQFPRFRIISDPAHITLSVNGNMIPGFASILRENVFQTDPDQDVTCLIALCQDGMAGHGSRLATIIHTLAEREARSTTEVSLDWFRHYLTLSLDPLLWLYLTHGIGLEAHQQNSLLHLRDGYPDGFFFRDNQDYYFHPAVKDRLDALLPGFSTESQTMSRTAETADERLIYYLFVNHLFGLINAFGVAGLVAEHLLLAEITAALDRHTAAEPTGPTAVLHKLRLPQLPTKANLISRFRGIDEMLTGSGSGSVYVPVENPLVIGNPSV